MIRILQVELGAIEKQTRSFEAILYVHISDLIVEEKELFVLYKQIKKAKKEKRLEQKKRGLNYKAPKSLKAIPLENKTSLPSKDQKEKKRLYREAMLYVHPDKFSMNQAAVEIATEVTVRLIEIYKTESLEQLQAYHAHIFKGNTEIDLCDQALNIKVSSKLNYLELEKEQLEEKLQLLKNSPIYKVIRDYKDPLSFVEELKEYYTARISTLKKRTRKGI